MKVTLSCSPFEALPQKIADNFVRAIQDAGHIWLPGVPLEVVPDLSVRAAEEKFTALWQVANERREKGG